MSAQMNYRELLELAAKACEIKHVDYTGIDYDGSLGLMRLNDQGLSSGLLWNPLTDDGDALRLAVKLQLSIHNEHVNAGCAYCTPSGDGCEMYPGADSGNGEDHVISEDYVATRRAIVLAAAEIGKAMP